MPKSTHKFKYFVRWYNESGNRQERGPLYNSEQAAIIARSKVSVGWQRVSIRIEAVPP